MTPLTADLVQDMPEASTVNMEEANGSPSDQSINGPQVQGMGELQAILEALLFVSSEPLSVARLVTVMGNVPKIDVEEALRHLG